MIRSLAAVGVLAVIVASATGCGSSDASKHGVVYYLAPTLMDEFQTASNLKMAAVAKEQGYELRSLNANNKASTQVNQMDDAISQKPKAIILNAVDASTMVASVEKARSDGVPVLAYDRFITDTAVDFTSVLGTTKMGRMAAAEVVRLLSKKYGAEKGTVLELMGDSGDTYTVSIDQSFRGAMAQHPGIKVIAKDTPQWEPTKSAQILDDLLSAGTKIDLIFVHADFRAPTLATVLEDHGFHEGDVLMLGTDGAPTGLQAIRDGWMIATVGIPMAQEVQGVWQYLKPILDGEEIQPGRVTIDGVESEIKKEKWGPTLYLPGVMVTSENVDDPSLWGNAEAASK